MMQTMAAPGGDIENRTPDRERGSLTVHDLLAGSLLVHDVEVPGEMLHPGLGAEAASGIVRLRPLKVGTLALISRASRDDNSLAPLLIIKESLVDPVLNLDQIRQLHAGLVHHLVASINRISGLDSANGRYPEVATSAIGEAHLQLARHYGWTPSQVAELTPAQVAVYLGGCARAEAGRRTSV